MNNQFKIFNKELLIDINRNSHRYEDIDDDFVSSINLLFGEIDFVKATISKGIINVYTESDNSLFKELTAECSEEVINSKEKYIPISIYKASYSQALNIDVKFNAESLNISDALKTEVINGLCSYNERTYNQLSNRYIDSLKDDLKKYEMFNKNTQLFALCSKLSLTYNFGFSSEDLKVQHKEVKEKLEELDTTITSKVLKGSLSQRLESTRGNEFERE